MASAGQGQRRRRGCQQGRLIEAGRGRNPTNFCTPPQSPPLEIRCVATAAEAAPAAGCASLGQGSGSAGPARLQPASLCRTEVRQGGPQADLLPALQGAPDLGLDRRRGGSTTTQPPVTRPPPFWPPGPPPPKGGEGPPGGQGQMQGAVRPEKTQTPANERPARKKPGRRSPSGSARSAARGYPWRSGTMGIGQR